MLYFLPYSVSLLICITKGIKEFCPSHARISFYCNYRCRAPCLELRTARLRLTRRRARFAQPGAYLAVRGSVDPVVVDPALVAQGDGSLPGAALALAHQEAAVDAAAQQVLSGVAGHRPVVP